MQQETRCEYLPWDSAFFGYDIASVLLSPQGDAYADIDTEVEKAREKGWRLLYVSMPFENDRLKEDLIQMGGVPVGHKVEYVKAVVKPPTPVVPDGHFDLCEVSSPALEQLVFQSGQYSRFRLDPAFADNGFERLYREWLESSLRGAHGKLVYVTGGSDRPRGLITLEPETAVRIGLLAVEKASRGQGLGRQLTAFAERYCHAHGAAELRVATQKENQGACRFYESYGFDKCSEIAIFHMWL